MTPKEKKCREQFEQLLFGETKGDYKPFSKGNEKNTKIENEIFEAFNDWLVDSSILSKKQLDYLKQLSDCKDIFKKELYIKPNIPVYRGLTIPLKKSFARPNSFVYDDNIKIGTEKGFYVNKRFSYKPNNRKTESWTIHKKKALEFAIGESGDKFGREKGCIKTLIQTKTDKNFFINPQFSKHVFKADEGETIRIAKTPINNCICYVYAVMHGDEHFFFGTNFDKDN